MGGIILTSAGFENPNIEKEFLGMLDKDAKDAAALWIPTAAIDENAKKVLPKCMDDLLKAGFQRENIHTYDLDYVMPYDGLKKYDAVYVCGGSCNYLLEQMKKANFIELVVSYVREGGIYIGVSAGSCVCSKSFDGIPFLPCKLGVHREIGKGNAVGSYDFAKEELIELANNQAVVITDSDSKIID